MRWSIEELIYGIKVASNRDYRFLYRVVHAPSSFIRMFQVIFKWIFTGYCWATIWSLDYTMIEFFIERLKMFKKMNKYGYPSSLSGEEEWNNIIDRLVHGFEIMNSEEYSLDYDRDGIKSSFKEIKLDGKTVTAYNVERTEEQKKEMMCAWKKQADYDKETMRLFALYFRNFWD